MCDEERELLATQIEQDLLNLYGSPILNTSQLQRALNYRSTAAVKQAIQRQTLPVPIFRLPNRRGWFAFVKDVGVFLAAQAFKKED